MSDGKHKPADPLSSSAPCSLWEACLRLGLDEDGARCPNCPVRGLCESETRWLASTTPAQRHRFSRGFG
jgi:hypothetical protein